MASSPVVFPEQLIEGDIFPLLGLENLDHEGKEKLLATIYEGIEARVALRIADLISPQQETAWQQLLEEGNDENTQTFLAQAGIDVQQLTLEEAILYKQKLLNLKNQNWQQWVGLLFIMN